MPFAFPSTAEAIGSGEQLPDGKRTTALLQVARSISGYDPERAAAVIARKFNETIRQ